MVISIVQQYEASASSLLLLWLQLLGNIWKMSAAIKN